MIGQGLDSSQAEMLVCPHPVPPDRRSKPHPNVLLKCPRCESLETKFCYYNNYSLTQPRYFCKKCKRYWTEGGTLRNVPVGGGLRKNKRSKQKAGGHGDAAAAEAASSAVTDTAIEATSHVASLNDSSLNADATELRYSNSSVNGNYSFDNARMAHQRVYEAGEQASLNSTLPQFGYAEELRNAPRFFPGYGYSYHPAQEAAGLPQYDAARYGYNLLDQRQSNSGEMSEVLEAMPSRSNQRSEQHHHQSIQQPLSLIQPEGEEEDDEEEDENQGYTKTKKLLPATANELESAAKSVNVKTENQQAASDEASSGVVNPYDWQQISEGLFTGMGDYFYLQGGSWPDMSHFDSGTR